MFLARITSLGTPTQTTDATQTYVDAQLQGLDVKNSVRVATTANELFQLRLQMDKQLMVSHLQLVIEYF